MITYQVKICIDPEVETEWLHWMRTVHVPDLIATGMLRGYRVLKPTIEEKHWYYFHYFFDSMADYEAYSSKYGPALKEDVIKRYEGKFVAERQVFEWL